MEAGMKSVAVHTTLRFGALMMAVCALGCEPQPPLNTRPAVNASAESGPVNTESEAVPPEIVALAAQMQRDVDLILKSRSGDEGKIQSSNEQSPNTGDAAAPAPKRTIVWNDPKPQPGSVAHADQPDDKSKPAPSTPTGESPTHPPTVSPSPSLEPDRLKTLMVDLSRELYATGSYSSTPLRELLAIAAMSLIDPQRRLDPNAIPDLTEKERELLGKLQAFFAELGESIAGGKQDSEKAIIEAVARLREGLVKPPSLRLATAALCTRVGGFGDYSTFDKNCFLAYSGGAQQKVIVYLEIDDFTSDLNAQNEYITKIAQQLTIYADRDGIPVWKEDWQTAVDITKNKRQDFFTVQVVTLPKALTVGKYHLKVRARDEKSGAEAEASIPFEMVADPRLAAAVPGK